MCVKNECFCRYIDEMLLMVGVTLEFIKIFEADVDNMTIE